jgi:hypothetical protein
MCLCLFQQVLSTEKVFNFGNLVAFEGSFGQKEIGALSTFEHEAVLLLSSFD